MELYFSPNSPFSRVARVALREAGLITTCREVLAKNRMPDNPVLDHSPLGRVPTLVDGPLVLTETRIVFDYIQAKAKGTEGQLWQGREPWTARSDEGLMFGVVESVVAWIREKRRPDGMRMDFFIGVERERATRYLAHLEHRARHGTIPEFPDYSGYVLMVGLGLLDVHELIADWRTTSPHLANWFDTLNARPSFQATLPTTP